MKRFFKNIFGGSATNSNQQFFIAILASTHAVSKPANQIRLRSLPRTTQISSKNVARMKLQRILEKA